MLSGSLNAYLVSIPLTQYYGEIIYLPLQRQLLMLKIFSLSLRHQFIYYHMKINYQKTFLGSKRLILLGIACKIPWQPHIFKQPIKILTYLVQHIRFLGSHMGQRPYGSHHQNMVQKSSRGFRKNPTEINSDVLK